MNNSWNSEDDEILINFVRMHDILYNTKKKEYRHTQLKKPLWCEVGEVLNRSDSDCYKRWCYVRDYYIRRRGKPDTSSGETARKRAKQLTFLDNIPTSNRLTYEIDFVDSEDASYNERDTEMYDQSNSSEGDSKYDEGSSKEFKGDFNLKQKLNSKELPVEIITPAQNELDENDLFFSSMAKIVKKLPRHEQARLRMQIGSLVGNAELRCIAIEPPSTSMQQPRPSGSSAIDNSEFALPSPSKTKY